MYRILLAIVLILIIAIASLRAAGIIVSIIAVLMICNTIASVCCSGNTHQHAHAHDANCRAHAHAHANATTSTPDAANTAQSVNAKA